MSAKKFTKIICAAAIVAAMTFSGCGGLADLTGGDGNKSRRRLKALQSPRRLPISPKVTQKSPTPEILPPCASPGRSVPLS